MQECQVIFLFSTLMLYFGLLYGARLWPLSREEKINKKIRESQITKVPYTVILGDQEAKDGTVTIRPYGTEENETMTIEEFRVKLLTEVKEKYSNRKK